RVYVTRRIPQKGVDVLLRDCNVSMWDSESAVPRGELLLNIAGVDAILCMAHDVIDAEVIAAAGQNLKVIVTMSSSIEDIDMETCKKRDIRVLECPKTGSESVADLTVALILLTLKKALSEVNKAYWKRCSNLTFGIYGLNSVGETVARKLKSYGIKTVIAHDVHPYKMVKNIEPEIKLVGWEELLEKSDVLCICDIDDERSKKQFDEDTFDMMKPNAVVVLGDRRQTEGNVNFVHLYQTLKDGKFDALGINSCNQGPVPYQYPLSGLHNCVFLPQTQESSFDQRHKTAVAMAGKLL
ncbi:hypothetical protein LOTGIDRAFT_74222, partial [Lottia gigantea]